MFAANGWAEVLGATGCTAVDSPYAMVGPYWKEAVPATGSGLVALPLSVADTMPMALA